MAGTSILAPTKGLSNWDKLNKMKLPPKPTRKRPNNSDSTKR